MGILDDAIREHLELKKKHGAPDEEVTRQEAEALGPARREVAFEAPPDADEPILGHAEALPVEHHAEAVPDPVDEELHANPDVHPDPDAPPPPAAPPAPAPVFHEDDPHAPPPPVPGFEPAEDTAPLEPAELPDSALPTDRRATQHLEAIGPDDAPPPPPADGDVLEETPDFLQETPEHDRLWFEQKPPRDFDFDD